MPQILFALLVSLLFTWGLGLLLPILLRFVIVKKQIGQIWAWLVIFMVFGFQTIGALLLGSRSKGHPAFALVAYVGYLIMRRETNTKENNQIAK
ncbi:MAG: hypothetical protein WCI36_03745 [bacterium]